MNFFTYLGRFTQAYFPDTASITVGGHRTITGGNPRPPADCRMPREEALASSPGTKWMRTEWLKSRGESEGDLHYLL